MGTLQQRPDYEARMKLIAGFRLLDDKYFRAVLHGNTPESIQTAELFLHIILQDDTIKVVKLKSDHAVPNPLGRSCLMDAVATDSTGRIFDVEMQRDSSKATPQRDRYYSSMLDIQQKPQQENYADLKDTYVIFITEQDKFHGGLPLYHIEPCIKETNTYRPNGAHTIYVNGAYTGDDALGRLMHDIKCSNHQDMHYDLLKNQMDYYKHSDKGVRDMFDVLDEYDAALVNNAVAKNIIKMGRKFGMTDTDIINTIASELGCPRPKAEEYFYEFSAGQQASTSA